MKKTETAIFGMGCFWSPQELFDHTNGVISTEVGYMGGKDGGKVTYEKVCSGKSGHAEVVKVEFDPDKISYSELLNIFWEKHNPTSKNRQGLNVGEQYRSVIFYTNEKQKKEAMKSREEFQKKLGKKMFTEIVKASKFHRAEEYHQKYIQKRNRRGGLLGL